MTGPIEREFMADPRAPSAARAFAKTALPTLLDAPVPTALCDDVELVVSELVTNAVRAGSAVVTVSVSLERTRIVLRVRDEAVGWPAQRAAGSDDPGGRGLPLVSALCATWGVRLAETGKVVFAELAVPGS
ncbi:MAG TPA: ATP-binding protein [Jatrophihabitans sp.]|nr:ATP-binding protein [Jatrophihabitans sp.]